MSLISATKVFTYYEKLKYHHYQQEIVDIWEESWRSRGFDPVVCTLDQAKAHPRYDDVLSAYDDINRSCYGKAGNAYNLSTIVRWLAWAQEINEPSIACDYDIINCSFRLNEPLSAGLVFRDRMCLCCMSTDKESANYFIACLLTYKAELIEHINKTHKDGNFHDQKLCQLLVEFYSDFKAEFKPFPIGKSLDEPSPLIHFSHKLCSEEDPNLTKEERDNRRFRVIRRGYQKHGEAKFLVKIPTYKRPNRVTGVVKNLIEKANKPDRLLFLLTIDENDFSLNRVAEEFKSYENVVINKTKADSKVLAYNAGLDIIDLSKFAAIVVLSDDVSVVAGYDDTIEAEVKKLNNFDFVLWFDEMPSSTTNLFPIIGKDFYARYGYIYNPIYRSYYCDDELTQTAFKLGKLKKVHKGLFSHALPDPLKMSDDYTYLRNMPDLHRDKAVFKVRQNYGFGVCLSALTRQSFDFTPFDLQLTPPRALQLAVHNLQTELKRSEVYLLDEKDREIQNMTMRDTRSFIENYFHSFDLTVPRIIHQFNLEDDPEVENQFKNLRELNDHFTVPFRFILWTPLKLKELKQINGNLYLEHEPPAIKTLIAALEVLNKLGGFFCGPNVSFSQKDLSLLCYPGDYGEVVAKGDLTNEFFGFTLANPLVALMLKVLFEGSHDPTFRFIDLVEKVPFSLSTKNVNEYMYLAKKD